MRIEDVVRRPDRQNGTSRPPEVTASNVRQCFIRQLARARKVGVFALFATVARRRGTATPIVNDTNAILFTVKPFGFG